MGRDKIVGRIHGDYTIESVDGANVLIKCVCGDSRSIRKDGIRRLSKKCNCNRFKDSAPGEKFNKLTVIKKTRRINGVQHYLFKCDCGVEKEQNIACVRYGSIKSCGCSKIGFNEEHQNEIIAAYENGESLKSLEKRFSTSGIVLNKLFKRMGVYIRNESERVRKFELNENRFELMDNEDMYWAGFMAADGNVKDTAIRIDLGDADIGHLRKFLSFMGSEHKIYKAKGRTTSFVNICSKKVAKNLNKINIVNNKTFIMNPTEECANSRDFWRGVIDGDGWVYDRKGVPHIGLCGSFDIVTAFMEWASKINGSKCTVRKSVNIFRISYERNMAIPIINAIYGDNPNYYLDRKYQVAKKFLDALH